MIFLKLCGWLFFIFYFDALSNPYPVYKLSALCCANVRSASLSLSVNFNVHLAFDPVSAWKSVV